MKMSKEKWNFPDKSSQKLINSIAFCKVSRCTLSTASNLEDLNLVHRQILLSGFTHGAVIPLTLSGARHVALIETAL